MYDHGAQLDRNSFLRREEKPEDPIEKTLEARERTSKKLRPNERRDNHPHHYTLSLRSTLSPPADRRSQGPATLAHINYIRVHTTYQRNAFNYITFVFVPYQIWNLIPYSKTLKHFFFLRL
jgi:hypothetical protein